MSKKVLILVEQDFQDMEVMYPYYRLKEAGFDVKVAGSVGLNVPVILQYS